jgi:hypothetical protein
MVHQCTMVIQKRDSGKCEKLMRIVFNHARTHDFQEEDLRNRPIVHGTWFSSLTIACPFLGGQVNREVQRHCRSSDT